MQTQEHKGHGVLRDPTGSGNATGRRESKTRPARAGPTKGPRPGTKGKYTTVVLAHQGRKMDAAAKTRPNTRDGENVAGLAYGARTLTALVLAYVRKRIENPRKRHKPVYYNIWGVS